MKEGKKFFVPEVYTHNGDISKSWFVWYYEPLVNGHVPKRVKVYGLNRIKTIEGRMQKAAEICERIRIDKPVVYGPKKTIKKQGESVLLDALDAMANYSDPKTIATYTGMADRFHLFITGRKDKQATREDALAFVNHLFDQKLSPKTVKSYRNNLKTLYNKYIDRYEPEGFKNPFRKMPVIKTSSRSLMYFNDFQIQLIKDYCINNNSQLWLACVLQYYCFIRPNELRQLKAEYVNLNAGYIEIPGTISKNRKTQKVSIPTALYPELKELIFIEPEAYIFGGVKPPSRDSLSKSHKKVLEELKIKGRYGFYSWKHTGVVKAWKAGVNIKDLQMQLRHHSLDMVNEYLKNLGVMDSDRIRDLFPAI